MLGGGLVPGGVVLIGGDPGIGKSTLLLQALARHGRDAQGAVRERRGVAAADRAARAAGSASTRAHVHVLAEINLEKIQAAIQAEKPEVAVIDSIQTLYSGQLQSAPGSVAQVRECAAQLTRVAKAGGDRRSFSSAT